MDNEIVPWIPLPDIPQTPCGIEVKGAPEHVSVRVVYSFYERDRDLLIEFQAEAFGCFSETAAPSTTVPADYPRLTHPTYSRYLWPLMEVTNSNWLSSYSGRLWWSDRPYRHFRIVSDDGTFDTITCHEPVARWEAVKS